MKIDIFTCSKNLFTALLMVSSGNFASAVDMQTTIPEKIAEDQANIFAHKTAEDAAKKDIGYRFFYSKNRPRFEHAAEMKNNIAYAEAYQRHFEEAKKENYAKLLSLFRQYEQKLSQSNALNQDPQAQVSGGISYAMTIDEMREVAKQKFQALKDQDKIITPREFEAIKNNYHEVEPQHTDLTRVWGADYLKKRFTENNTQNFDVPDYVIVTENPNHLKIELNLANSENPRISALKNGHIYFQRIEGTPIANTVGHNIKSTGYADFATGGHDQQKNRNILKDNTSGINYVVDTEIKSFAFERDYHGVSPSYIMKRFMLLNNTQENGHYPIEIDLD